MTRWLRIRIRLDRLVAGLLMLMVGPMILVAALIVRRHDGGPAFVRLRRVGRQGEAFTMWKLRTMKPEGERGHAGGSILSASDDERVTRVGVTLRRFRLDELPQLLNVVKGEMSLIGPRPEDPEFVALPDSGWQAALNQPPGIAGPTQILVHDWEGEVLATTEREASYREVVLPAKLATDKWYVANASPLTDLFVVLALIERFAAGRTQTIVHRRLCARLPPEIVRMLEANIQAGATQGNPGA